MLKRSMSDYNNYSNRYEKNNKIRKCVCSLNRKQCTYENTIRE